MDTPGTARRITRPVRAAIAAAVVAPIAPLFATFLFGFRESGKGEFLFVVAAPFAAVLLAIPALLLVVVFVIPAAHRFLDGPWLRVRVSCIASIGFAGTIFLGMWANHGNMIFVGEKLFILCFLTAAAALGGLAAALTFLAVAIQVEHVSRPG